MSHNQNKPCGRAAQDKASLSSSMHIAVAYTQCSTQSLPVAAARALAGCATGSGVWHPGQGLCQWGGASWPGVWGTASGLSAHARRRRGRVASMWPAVSGRLRMSHGVAAVAGSLPMAVAHSVGASQAGRDPGPRACKQRRGSYQCPRFRWEAASSVRVTWH